MITEERAEWEMLCWEALAVINRKAVDYPEWEARAMTWEAKFRKKLDDHMKWSSVRTDSENGGGAPTP